MRSWVPPGSERRYADTFSAAGSAASSGKYGLVRPDLPEWGLIRLMSGSYRVEIVALRAHMRAVFLSNDARLLPDARLGKKKTPRVKGQSSLRSADGVAQYLFPDACHRPTPS